jgi:hypothetical protein
MTGIRLGMTQAELTQEIGKPASVRPPMENKHGQTEVVVEYTMKGNVPGSGTAVAKEVLTSGSGFFDDPTEPLRYLFHFIDDRLARWGPDTAAAKPMEEPAKDPKKDPAKDPAKDPIKDPIKDPAKNPAKDPGKGPG